MYSNNISVTFQQTKKGESFTYDSPSFYINDMLSEKIIYVVRKYNISF